MASPAFKANYSLIDWSDLKPRQKTFRSSPRRSDLAAPMLIRPFAQPVQSMADGKYYDTPGELSRSHRAAHNPHGQDFIELGNEQMQFVEHKSDEKQLRDDVRAAMQDVKEGRLPEVLNLAD